MLGQMTSQDFFAQLDERLDKKIEEKILPVRNAVTSLEDTVKSQGKEISELRSDMENLKGKCGSSRAGSGVPARALAARQALRGAPFQQERPWACR